MTTKYEGCQLVILFNFFFFLKVHALSCPKRYTSQNPYFHPIGAAIASLNNDIIKEIAFITNYTLTAYFSVPFLAKMAIYHGTFYAQNITDYFHEGHRISVE